MISSARLELYKVGEPVDKGQYDAEQAVNRVIAVYPMLSHFEAGSPTDSRATKVSCFSYRVYDESDPVYWGDQNRLENGPVAGVDYEEAPIAKIPLEPGNSDQWYTCDLTSPVQKWVSGDQPNEGLYLRAFGFWIGAYFASSESEKVELRPKLVVEWSK